MLSSFICGSLTYEIRCWLSVMFMMCISVVWSTLMMLYVGVCCAWRWTSAMSIQDPVSKIHLFEQGSSMHIIFAAQCRASAVYAVMRCPSVYPSVTFVDSVKTSNHIVTIFSPLSSYTILVFHTKPHAWQYSDGNPQIRASSARWVWKK